MPLLTDLHNYCCVNERNKVNSNFDLQQKLVFQIEGTLRVKQQGWIWICHIWSTVKCFGHKSLNTEDESHHGIHNSSYTTAFKIVSRYNVDSLYLYATYFDRGTSCFCCYGILNPLVATTAATPQTWDYSVWNMDFWNSNWGHNLYVRSHLLSCQYRELKKVHYNSYMSSTYLTCSRDMSYSVSFYRTKQKEL